VPTGGGGTPTGPRRRVRRSADPTAEGSCDGSRISPTIRERLRTGTGTRGVPTSPPPPDGLALRIDDVTWPSSVTIQIRGVNRFGPASAHPSIGIRPSDDPAITLNQSSREPGAVQASPGSTIQYPLGSQASSARCPTTAGHNPRHDSSHPRGAPGHDRRSLESRTGCVRRREAALALFFVRLLRYGLLPRPRRAGGRRTGERSLVPGQEGRRPAGLNLSRATAGLVRPAARYLRCRGAAPSQRRLGLKVTPPARSRLLGLDPGRFPHQTRDQADFDHRLERCGAGLGDL
jgi:hypothetical protein